jgi:predicted nucleic acid-binding protein
LVAPRPYADASALVKLVLRERESDALRSYLLTRSDPATSRISVVEVARAMTRAEGSPQDEAVAALWERTLFVEVDASLADSAARLEPPTLRSLDAIHLASARALADELEAFVTYDARQAEAARAVGLEVISPA